MRVRSVLTLLASLEMMERSVADCSRVRGLGLVRVSLGIAPVDGVGCVGMLEEVVVVVVMVAGVVVVEAGSGGCCDGRIGVE